MPASSLPTRSAPTSAALVKIPPPIRANSAIDEAPIANPAMISVKCPNCASVMPAGLLRSSSRFSITPTPRSPSEATARPITEPPPNATRSAAAAPWARAASVVRTLAFVAARIPMNPALSEQRPPATKASPTGQPTARLSRMATTTSTGSSTVYWRRRNAMAPASIRPAMIGRSPVPGGSRLTQRYTPTAASSPTTPPIGA